MADNKKRSDLGAAVAGAIVGGAAVAAAVKLSDKKTQQQIKQGVKDLSGRARELINRKGGEAKGKIEEVKTNAEEAINATIPANTDKPKKNLKPKNP